MPAQKGKDVLLKVDNAGSFITIAGLRTRRLTFNAQSVDVTNSESTGRWRELLEGVGVRHASINGTGIFKDEASDVYARQLFFDGSIKTWQVLIPNFGTISGLFQMVSLDYRGDHSGEVTFDISMESAGALTFTAL
jgi:TP901-1 family phage major tail protein